jgi:hypothetical protein
MRGLLFFCVASAAAVVVSCGDSFTQATAGGDASIDVTTQPDGGESCKPKLCPDLRKECGATDDGCGKSIDCGACVRANTACQDGKCVCKSRSCRDQNANCGEVPDGCGNKLACGSCDNGETCGAGGPNKCGVGTCVPKTCQSVGAQCGQISDGCGNIVTCPDLCVAPQRCGAGGQENKCGCVGLTCPQLGWRCGSGDNGCGQQITCPSCPSGFDCQNHQCVCTPKRTCASEGYNCGTMIDDCGMKQTCGPDPAPDPVTGDVCADSSRPHLYRCQTCGVVVGSYTPRPPVPGGTCSGPTPPNPDWDCVAMSNAPVSTWCCAK